MSAIYQGWAITERPNPGLRASMGSGLNRSQHPEHGKGNMRQNRRSLPVLEVVSHDFAVAPGPNSGDEDQQQDQASPERRGEYGIEDCGVGHMRRLSNEREFPLPGETRPARVASTKTRIRLFAQPQRFA